MTVPNYPEISSGNITIIKYAVTDVDDDVLCLTALVPALNRGHHPED
ncbi:hypothetical protein [Leptothoe kymatousa]|uniref:Uncharacterized protein n=1 Tax=Leptothoe kymatousa TAU-MAC 1615 TaxID=2364775 RepID=A0ABS5Y6X4_9CYAN|nr:hypothetical protein [Leptothoe kymatousa]MBT9313578.1 hypothetical protein [Leptothoe kymatousa TAU-MAC 1615]